METTLPLLKGRITLQEALEEDEDVIKNLSYPEKRAIFWLYLDRRRSQIAEIVSRHLNIPLAAFQLGELGEWIHGSFNACIPIHITHPPRPNLPRRVIIRFPLPYKTGEEYFPGNVDEKLRCEAATYIWLQSNCPAVPIPRLYGFGFPGTQSFTALENEPFYNRMIWYFRSVTSWMSGHTLSPYFAHSRRSLLEVGYLVIEHVDEGKMLSQSWKECQGDQARRANHFQDLSRIILSLAKLRLPRIGSWTMNDQGVPSLTNRPLTFQLHQLENLQISTDIPRDFTYMSVDPYCLDIFACHDNRIRHQPNSIHHQTDALLPNNIFVDDDWHITCLIDLEWACVHPIEMLSPPYWLSSPGIGKSAPGIDELIGDDLDKYARAHKEFMDAFETEELALYKSDEYTNILQTCWETGSFWYSQALDCPSALYAIFMFHIQPKFADLSNTALDEFSQVVMPYWDRDTPNFISSKVKQQEHYSNQIRKVFAAASPNLPTKRDEDHEAPHAH
ncbi:hypothetical protein QBC33DRAFT_610224 [Phialemonium atrogriseum]|uniref:Aminoglycoside phosphotransferase domain-containing protein n=1 Tax=Phialemonium atrogriseum TaxID=1093897 RepID=A0AAJ0C2U8_9PEZI|nr:uncharacterized protein QBC33DRAFT_610224 [Phialemonium atrogriseum]KAK1768901.1 hypothetical protein QBC33DRAFT_610224 [Phialemonium atrogriseum]